MNTTLKLGRQECEVTIPDDWPVVVLEPRLLAGIASPSAAIRTALANPNGTPPLRELVQRGERVCLVVNDITRRAGTELFLPVLLEELNGAGVPDTDIFIVFALGLHRAHTRAEQELIVGSEIASRITLIDHDSRDSARLVALGTTSRGNRVLISREVCEADRVIITGEIIHHLIAGFSGGRKSIMPGVAGADTITFNHSMIFDPGCRAGLLEGNPAHEDMMEACSLLDPDFMVNLVLNPTGEVVHVAAGHWAKAHHEGCQVVDRMFRVDTEEAFDLVIASAGGFPYDINMYQAQKGLENAFRILRPNGCVIYFAECSQGSGNRFLDEWMSRYGSAAEIEKQLKKQFVIGGHKAYWVARLAETGTTILVSGLDPDQVQRFRMLPARDASEALGLATAQLGPAPKTAVLPWAALTLPTLASPKAAAS